MSRPLICPVDHAAMRQGEDGVWRCRKQPGHTFRLIRQKGRPRPGARHCYSNMACPICSEEMSPVAGAAGAWRCTADPRHLFEVAHRAPEIIRQSPLIDRATNFGSVHWLSHIGITGALLPPPQGAAGPPRVAPAVRRGAAFAVGRATS